MLASEAVETVRSMLSGSQIDEISVLSAPYVAATDTSLTLQYPKRSVAAGSTVTVGLNTFTVMAIGSDGTSLSVIPSMDGGPNVDAAQSSIVRIRPQFTTWSIFREIQSEIDSLSSAYVGVYQPWIVEASTLDRSGGIYALPDRTDGQYATRILKAEFLVAGVDSLWVPFTDVELVRQGNTIRVFSDPPQVAGYRFSLAVGFVPPSALTDDLVALGITNAISGIPINGAAATMALSWEGRRVQPVFQGDSRRASEVQPTSSSSLARQFRQQQQNAITEEAARLAKEWGYRQPIVSGYTLGVTRWSL
jgi:hypothetical protein